jgi:hypothetical protein
MKDEELRSKKRRVTNMVIMLWDLKTKLASHIILLRTQCKFYPILHKLSFEF